MNLSRRSAALATCLIRVLNKAGSQRTCLRAFCCLVTMPAVLLTRLTCYGCDGSAIRRTFPSCSSHTHRASSLSARPTIVNLIDGVVAVT